MLITKRSTLTGHFHTFDLPVDPETLRKWESGEDRRMVQHVFPDLTPDQREFLMTGTTNEEWDEAFGEEEFPGRAS